MADHSEHIQHLQVITRAVNFSEDLDTSNLFLSEDGRSPFFQNIVNRPPDDTMSHKLTQKI
jgi:hypothetical protein